MALKELEGVWRGRGAADLATTTAGASEERTHLVAELERFE